MIAALAVVLVAAVAGFYAYGRYKTAKAIHDLPSKLGVDIHQTTQGFTFTKSDGGRRIFSISAGRAVQLKQGQLAELHDVRIVIFGRGNTGTPGTQDNTYDQIYGKEFRYDPETGEVSAPGEVAIDLNNQGEPPADPRDTKPGPGNIHLKTSGLSFNQKTGMAETKDAIEFSLPQAKGVAHGARYDAKKMTLDLLATVRVTATAEGARSAGVNLAGTTLDAGSASILDRPVRAELRGVNLHQGDRTLAATTVTLGLDAHNQIQKLIATGDVRARREGKAPAEIKTGQIDFTFSGDSQLRKAKLSGGVALDASGPGAWKARSQALDLDFGPKSKVSLAHASGQVQLEQAGKGAQKIQMLADAVDFFLKSDGSLDRAATSGKAIIVTSDPGGKNGNSTVTADRFDALFASGNRLRTIHGAPNAKVVSQSPGQADRMTTSREVTASFAPTGDKGGQLTGLVQQGDFRYNDGERSATAGKAQFSAQDNTILLTEGPRIQSKERGNPLAVTADRIRMDRTSGDFTAEGSVKASYEPASAGSEDKGLFNGKQAVHATADSMTGSRSSGGTVFKGNARLWQGADQIVGDTIRFDRAAKSLQATAKGTGGVQTAFLRAEKNGRTSVVRIASGQLEYSDQSRKALFSGTVSAKSDDIDLTAGQLEVFLQSNAQSPADQAGPARIERMTATRNVHLEGKTPPRTGDGEKLEYTASDGRFVLTGTEAKPPSIFDAERGKFTGNSLTFFSLDGRVQVVGGEKNRTVTRTRVKEEPKP